MAPVLEQDKMRPILCSLLDEYGDDTSVLSVISSQMNTYSWVGSIIPLLEKRKMYFLELLNHKRVQARQRAEKG